MWFGCSLSRRQEDLEGRVTLLTTGQGMGANHVFPLYDQARREDATAYPPKNGSNILPLPIPIIIVPIFRGTGVNNVVFGSLVSIGFVVEDRVSCLY